MVTVQELVVGVTVAVNVIDEPTMTEPVNETSAIVVEAPVAALPLASAKSHCFRSGNESPGRPSKEKY